MEKKIPNLIANRDVFVANKEAILTQWVSYDSPQQILNAHAIDKKQFLSDYAGGVFDYFIGVISYEVVIGDCPIMQNLIIYLKDKAIRADELFEICSHFRKSMIDFTYDVKLNSKAVFDEISFLFDQNFQGVLRYYTDTIFQKEQEINRNVKLLREYQKAMDESAIISKTDEEGTITYVNEKYVQLSGYSAPELIGSKHSIFKHEDMPQDYFDDLWFQLHHGGIFRGTIKNNKKNGEYFYVDVTIVKIADEYDNSVEYISIANDVTKLIDARLEAQRASRAKEYFLSNMSHEIRTPLNAILGFVNLLIEQDVSKQHRKYLEIILNSGENLLSIINDILDFSKLRSGEFTIEPKIFSIHDEISHALELFVASANTRDITITSFIDPSIPRELFADALRIKQILSNFLSNAIKFTKPFGHIHVEVTCNRGTLRVSVSDSGVGIANEDLKNIFAAFTQANHEGIENYEGTGLGLSICHQLSKHMGGEIFVKSTLGKGSTFWIEIPVEIHSKECKIFDEIYEIKALKIIFYLKNGALNYKADSFFKYAKVFNIHVDIVEDFEREFDIAIMLEEDIDDAVREKIVHSNEKYIILTSKPSDKYEKYSHISSIYFPLYCSKIKNAFEDLFHPELSCPYRIDSGEKFSGHILIAEDNIANQELIKILLSKYGLTYDLATNGLEAVNLYKKNNYDLILMDEQMPVMDGNAAVQAIIKYEKEKGLRHTPISALTANVIKGARERGLKSGFDSFLGKPIITKELERVFFNYLKISKATPQSQSGTTTKKCNIEGLDYEKLTQELMLSPDELTMLMDLFIKKMQKILPELKEAIVAKEYKKIAFLAHSIKGSSGNFRLEEIQEEGAKMELMAKNQDEKYRYEAAFEKIKERLEKIKIIY